MKQPMTRVRRLYHVLEALCLFRLLVERLAQDGYSKDWYEAFHKARQNIRVEAEESFYNIKGDVPCSCLYVSIVSEHEDRCHTCPMSLKMSTDDGWDGLFLCVASYRALMKFETATIMQHLVEFIAELEVVKSAMLKGEL